LQRPQPLLKPIEQLPGFRRRVRITPRSGAVDCEFEDDYHRMSVTVRHDGAKATSLDAAMQRAPWNICPGAVEQLRQTFTGVPLVDFAARGEKRRNCTHLHDMAVLSAAHAMDAGPLVYDSLVSDPVDGRRQVEIRRDGMRLLGWIDEPVAGSGYNCIVEPAELAGARLDQLRPWIQSLDPERREAARLLQWCAIIARGRRLSLEKHADASGLGTGRCYTFDERRVQDARRTGDIRDFSQGTAQLLARTS
jgi:hypothetical protein